MAIPADIDDYPSLWWLAIAPALVSAYVARRWYLARRLRVYGIGKGAPGFQTNVRRIRVTPEIAARIRRGEDVSPDEIARASALAEAQEAEGRVSGSAAPMREATPPRADKSANSNEWLPETVTSTRRRGRGKKG